MKNMFKVSLFALLLLVLGACNLDDENTGGSDSSSDEIKIGIILAETGPASTLGEAQVNTVKLLQKEIDERGEIGGKKVKLVKHDYETDDTKAVIAMDKLISDGAVAVIGATQSGASMAILPKALEQKVPLFTLAPISTGGEYIYGMAHTPEVIAMPIIEYLEENGIQKVGWINASDGFGVTGLPAFETLAKDKGIEVVAHEEFDASATDMTIQLSKIKTKNPEAVIVWSRTPAAGVVARNFQSLGFDIPMIQSTAAANKGFIEQVKGNSKNIHVLGSKMNVVEQLPDSEMKTQLSHFKESYTTMFEGKEPDLFAAHVYDGVQLVLQAIEEGHYSREEIQTYLQSDMGDFLGATGTFNFKNDQMTPDYDGITIMAIEEGDWKYISNGTE
ncbi:MAG TPA: ABC transporter substrate-binding protein [Cerasibacillus sp.]|uniref:ABC transporter substrate-binding protein n=1 Tax=Cerasibacillus sp. TaxID=2498711 RepID=UPI002F41F4A8